MARHHLRQRLTTDTEYYDAEMVVKYVDFLEENGRLIRVDNLYFDAEAMLEPFACDTCQCIPGPDGRTAAGKKRSSSCCVVMTPRLSTTERERMDGILPGLLERFPDLAARVAKAGGYYEWDDGYDRMVLKSKDGLCIFMTQDTEEFGFHACQVHAWCLENGKEPGLYKPSACVMFPLFLLDIDGDDETALVSRHSRETSIVADDEENYRKVGCLGKGSIGRIPLYVTMKSTLEYMFSPAVWRALDARMREWCRENDRPEPPVADDKKLEGVAE